LRACTIFVIVLQAGHSRGKLGHIAFGAHQSGNRFGAAFGVGGVAAGERCTGFAQRFLKCGDRVRHEFLP
jgi:hypothetical protein